jgi:hypothetical protein
MRYSRSLAIAVVACTLATGCVIVPVTVEGYDSECRVVTRHMELQAVQIGAIQNCSNQACAGLVIVAAGLAAASAIVSGSVVVIGNIGYWAERKSTCLLAPPPPPLGVVPAPPR